MFSYQNASRIAHDFLSRIQDVCDKHDIVGSLRRQRDYVNDIDIIVIPKVIRTSDGTLFDNPVETNLLDACLDKLAADGLLTFETNGAKLKRFHLKARPKVIPVDLYIATEETWHVLRLIRTGSRNHNMKLVRRANELHMILKADGTGLLSAGGSPIPIQDEIDIFRQLKVPFRLPQERE
jgi:DNA polymerase/3'-5' exonuclease PolX